MYFSTICFFFMIYLSYEIIYLFKKYLSKHFDYWNIFKVRTVEVICSGFLITYESLSLRLSYSKHS